MATHKTTITREVNVRGNDCEVEIDITVEFDYTPAERGLRDEYGVQMGPDEAAAIEIVSVTDEDGTDIELTENERSTVLNEIWDKEKWDS